MNTSHYRRLIVSIFLTVTLLGIFLPGILLHHTFEADLDTIQAVPENQYNSPNSAMARNASAKLSEYEQIKLIAGTWDSTQTPVDSSLSNITEIQAVELAKAAVSELYQSGGYPYCFDSLYNNWYSWEAQCFQCTENAFNTYSTYCWLVTFSRYNEDEIHDVLITEQGTLLGIRNNRPSDSEKNTQPVSWYINIQDYFENKYASSNIKVSFLKITNPKSLSAYTNMTIDNPVVRSANILILNNTRISSYADFNDMINSQVSENTEIYHVYQCSNTEYFMITIIPYS